MTEISVETGGKKFEAELANTLLKKSWGLSMRKKGKMLFVFSRPGRPPIDMMLVQEPLHLYFLDREKKVVDVKHAEPWTLNPRTWRVYRPSRDAKYLLETFEELDLEKGDQVDFQL
jgi:uncharacterized membrane protein (UPF0127 family)